MYALSMQISRGGQSVTLVGDTLVMFGGEDAKRALLNDLHILDLETMTWDDMDAMYDPSVLFYLFEYILQYLTSLPVSRGLKRLVPQLHVFKFHNKIVIQLLAIQLFKDIWASFSCARYLLARNFDTSCIWLSIRTWPILLYSRSHLVGNLGTND